MDQDGTEPRLPSSGIRWSCWSPWRPGGISRRRLRPPAVDRSPNVWTSPQCGRVPRKSHRRWRTAATSNGAKVRQEFLESYAVCRKLKRLPLSLSLSLSICPSLNRSRFGIKGSWCAKDRISVSRWFERIRLEHVYKLYSDRSSSWHLLVSGQMGVYACSLHVLFSIEGNFLFFSLSLFFFFVVDSSYGRGRSLHRVILESSRDRSSFIRTPVVWIS